MKLDMNKVLLLNSGGSDSVATAFLLKRAGYEVYSMFIDYGQPSALVERDSAHLMMINYGFTSVKTPEKFFETKLYLDSAFDSDENDDKGQEIFLRNFVFMSYATQHAYSNGIGNVATGYTAMQTAIHYVDDNPIFLQDYHSLIEHFGMRFLTPIAGFDKEMTYSTLLDYGVDPAELPYCNFGDKPCGTCSKCELTNRALTELKRVRKERGIEDGVLSKSLDPIFAENS